MDAGKLIEKVIWQENELYNLYKLGETFALFERPELRDDFFQLAEEELRHRKTLESLLSEGTIKGLLLDYMEELELEPMVHDDRANPESLEELVVEALIREKHAYELYTKLSNLLEGSLSQIFRMMAGEELKHAYRLRIIYEKIDG
ncbi:ferritin family protein [Thermococcus peptonophilus]|uniref:Rubrerythrin family protein n=1 Tax=Thermococcus peptonophilus TaxID=53952 RepID=A0A142CVN8_9EURY|nr:ferritin family protein [Thermococcus peptonophilus]AMQ18840.1 rubrerythrin family protein [Thermococcus peptonophilus]